MRQISYVSISMKLLEIRKKSLKLISLEKHKNVTLNNWFSKNKLHHLFFHFLITSSNRNVCSKKVILHHIYE